MFCIDFLNPTRLKSVININIVIVVLRMRSNVDKHFKIKMSNRNFTKRFDVFMTSLSSDKKITVQQCHLNEKFRADGIRLRVPGRFTDKVDDCC